MSAGIVLHCSVLEFRLVFFGLNFWWTNLAIPDNLVHCVSDVTFEAKNNQPIFQNRALGIVHIMGILCNDNEEVSYVLKSLS